MITCAMQNSAPDSMSSKSVLNNGELLRLSVEYSVLVA